MVLALGARLGALTDVPVEVTATFDKESYGTGVRYEATSERLATVPADGAAAARGRAVLAAGATMVLLARRRLG